MKLLRRGLLCLDLSIALIVAAADERRSCIFRVTTLSKFVACCKSNNGTTKARRYRFRKRSKKKKRTSYLELKKTQ
jgi:hypothetical protein